MSKNWKQRGFTLLRIGVCIGLLWWVFSEVAWNDFVTLTDGTEVRLLAESNESIEILDAKGDKHTLRRTDIAGSDDGAEQIRYGLPSLVKRSEKRYLPFYVLIFAPVPLIMAKRLQWLLRAQDIHIAYWESIKLCYAGNFLNFTLIGSTGGDLFKAYYVTLHTEHKTEAVTTVMLDRVIGLIGMFIMVAMVTVPAIGRPYFAWVAGFCLLFLAGVVVGCVLLVSPRVRALMARLPGVTRLPMLAHFHRAEAAIRRVLQRRWLLFWSLVFTVTIHWVCTTSFFFGAMTLGMDTGGSKWVEYYAWIATGNIVAAIPISFMGLGTMEAFYREFLGVYASVSQLVLLAMCIRLVQLFWSLPGALVALTGAYRPRSADALDELTMPESGPAAEGNTALSPHSDHIPEKI
ncbi:MAG: flippase-like domain-containing protein [Planctomycetes bacterium]|nr:flippase-like domain-containing protein [Planctomycetota bacterium]